MINYARDIKLLMKRISKMEKRLLIEEEEPGGGGSFDQIAGSPEDNEELSVYLNPVNLVYLSRLGIVSDANLDIGSGVFGSDQTEAVQAILDQATKEKPLHVVWDCRVSVRGLRVKSYTYIRAARNCGAILRDGSDDHLLRNYNWKAGSNQVVDSSITVEGGVWNGNGFRDGIARQVYSTRNRGLLTGFSFYGVENLLLMNFEIRNTRTYAALITTTRNLLIKDYIVNQGDVVEVGQDGIGVIGLAEGVTIINGTMTCSGDRFVFISDATGGGVNAGVFGIQENIRIDNIYFKGEGKGFRFSSETTQQLNVFVTNISGTAKTSWLYIQNESNVQGGGNAMNMGFGNVYIEIAQMRDSDSLTDHYGHVQISANCQNVRFVNCTRDDHTLPYPTIAVHGEVTVKELIIDLFSRDEQPDIFNHIHIVSGTVEYLKVSGRVCRTGMPNASNIVKVDAGAMVRHLHWDNAIGVNITTGYQVDGEVITTTGTPILILDTMV